MLLRSRIHDPERRLRVGQLSLVIGILLERFGPRLPGFSGSPFWSGLLQGSSVTLIAVSIALSVSGARALVRRS